MGAPRYFLSQNESCLSVQDLFNISMKGRDPLSMYLWLNDIIRARSGYNSRSTGSEDKDKTGY